MISWGPPFPNFKSRKMNVNDITKEGTNEFFRKLKTKRENKVLVFHYKLNITYEYA